MLTTRFRMFLSSSLTSSSSSCSTLARGNIMSSGSSLLSHVLCRMFTCFHREASSCIMPSSVSWMAVMPDSISLSKAAKRYTEPPEHRTILYNTSFSPQPVKPCQNRSDFSPTCNKHIFHFLMSIYCVYFIIIYYILFCFIFYILS